MLNSSLTGLFKIVYSNEANSIELPNTTNPLTVYTTEESGLYLINWSGHSTTLPKILYISNKEYDISAVGSEVVVASINAGTPIKLALNGNKGNVIRHKLTILKLG